MKYVLVSKHLLKDSSTNTEVKMDIPTLRELYLWWLITAINAHHAFLRFGLCSADPRPDVVIHASTHEVHAFVAWMNAGGDFSHRLEYRNAVRAEVFG